MGTEIFCEDRGRGRRKSFAKIGGAYGNLLQKIYAKIGVDENDENLNFCLIRGAKKY